MVAALYGSLAETKLLTDSSLGEVVKMTSEGIFRYRQYVDVNSVSLKGNTALVLAVAEGHLDIAEELLAKKAVVNRQNEKGVSVLMTASRFGYLDLVKKLLERSADVNAQNKVGYNALDMAKHNKHFSIVELLTSKGAEHSQAWKERSLPKG